LADQRPKIAFILATHAARRAGLGALRRRNSMTSAPMRLRKMRFSWAKGRETWQEFDWGLGAASLL